MFKARVLKGKYEAKLEIQEGRGGGGRWENQNPKKKPLGEVWIYWNHSDTM